MASKKYVVREGFVLFRKVVNPANDQTVERQYMQGDTVEMDDDEYAQHAHKLEFAAQKDRDAALAAERQAAVNKAAAAGVVDVVSMLAQALQQAAAANAPASAAPAPAAPQKPDA
jgi:hypothetical protein